MGFGDPHWDLGTPVGIWGPLMGVGDTQRELGAPNRVWGSLNRIWGHPVGFEDTQWVSGTPVGIWGPTLAGSQHDDVIGAAAFHSLPELRFAMGAPNRVGDPPLNVPPS